MARASRKRVRKSAGANESATQQFRRRMHQHNSLRVGLTHARWAISAPRLIPSIVAYLAAQPIYRSALTPNTFPKALNDYRKWRHLGQVGLVPEILWTASVLSLFEDQLAKFVQKRNEYFDSYLHGRLEVAAETLSEIEAEFGVSRWLLGHRFHVLQLTKGLQAQKDMLEEVMSAESLSDFIAWSAYYKSMQAETSVSFATLENHHLALKGELGDYFLHVVLPHKQASISDPGAPLSWDETSCIVDRFESCVAMALLAISSKAGEEEGAELLTIALKKLAPINDDRVIAAIEVLTGNLESSDSQVVDLADAYSAGRYEEVITDKRSPIELAARAWALSGQAPRVDESSSIRDQLVALMYDIVVMSPDALASEQKLKKMALPLNGHPVAYEIMGFLERSHDHVFVKEYELVDRLSALGSSIHNPWNAGVISQLCGSGDWLSHLLAAHPGSLALKLRASLSQGSQAQIDALTELPDYRRTAYLGHIAMMTNPSDAIALYSAGVASPIPYVAETARRYLFDAYVASGRVDEAIQSVVDHVFVNPGAAQFYPLEKVASLGVIESGLRSTMALAVVVHLASKEAPSMERDLSDIYENVLDAIGVVRPSEIPDPIDGNDPHALIYFLRFVCVPRVLDDSTQFDNVDEIENERIAICQRLLKLDPSNDATYLAEIRAITLEANVSHLLKQVQTSKIYVDEGGIRQVIEPNLRDSFSRLQELRESPRLADQAEKISRRLNERFGAKAPPEFKGIDVPASAGESLFAQMLSSVGSEFAFNPAYGLDTHISTSIRHGAFEGHLRSPLAVEDLLCVRRDGELVAPDAWVERFADLDARSRNKILKALMRFTERFEDFVNSYLKEKLHIWHVGGNAAAMINFQVSPEERAELTRAIDPSADYETFVDWLLAHHWALTTAGLESIQKELSSTGLSTISSALDSLARAATTVASRDQVASLLDAVARARTAFHSALDDVVQWFQRPTDLSREPFEVEVAARVALKQIENCYVKSKLNPELQFSGCDKLSGVLLDGVCEILFVLLQNAILRSEFHEQGPEVKLVAHLDGGCLTIRCENTLCETIDIDERKASANEALQRYERDSALRMARKEGGSGLSKVWRIAEFDLRCSHSIALEVTNERTFVVTLELGGLAVAP